MPDHEIPLPKLIYLTPTLDEMSGADALAEAIGGTPPQECSTDEKVILIAV